MEDDGTSTAYESGSNITTIFTLLTNNDTATLSIGAGIGKGFEGQATQRWYEISILFLGGKRGERKAVGGDFDMRVDLVGAWPATTVEFNGEDIPFLELPTDNDYFLTSFWTYDPSSLTVSLYIASPTSTSEASTVKFSFANSLDDPLLGYGFARKLVRLQECKDLLDDDWGTYPFCTSLFPSSFSLRSSSFLVSLQSIL